MRTFDAICDVFSALEEGGLQLRPEVGRHDDPEPGDGHPDAGAVVGAGAALQAVELLGEGGVVEREVVQLQSAIGQQQQLVLTQQCRVEIKQRQCNAIEFNTLYLLSICAAAAKLLESSISAATAATLSAAGPSVATSPCWARISNTEGCSWRAGSWPGKVEVRKAEEAIARLCLKCLVCRVQQCSTTLSRGSCKPVPAS